MDSEVTTQQISKYNSAVAQLQRLDNLWQDAHRHSRSGNYLAWNNDLDKIWSELAGDFKVNNEHEKVFNEFLTQLGKAGTISREEIRGFKTKQSPDKSKQYLILLNKEIWLRRLQNKLGKGTKWDEGEDDYMD